MPIKNVSFVCACPVHGLEISDGSKNECCDAAVIMPMLSEAELAQLVPAGRGQYEAELIEVAHMVEAGKVDPNQDATFANWYTTVGYPLIESKMPAENTQEPELHEAEVEHNVYEEEPDEDQEGGAEHFFMLGFQNGFSAGFERGFDTGNRLKVN